MNAFITCPYNDGKEILEYVDGLPSNLVFRIRAMRLDVQLYNPSATPILVCCDWRKSISSNHMIPALVAIPLMLLEKLPNWEWSKVGETWENMRYYFLGSPHGKKSGI